MLTSNWIILDVASASIANAADYLDADDIKAPSNYKSPEAIAKYQQETASARLSAAALDLDLARITAIGQMGRDYQQIGLCQDEDAERMQLIDLVEEIGRAAIVTYNGHGFDLPLLMRRARYLGVTFPAINLDRYRSPHLDLCELLSGRDPKRRRSLSWYVKRLGWTDLVKPLDGAEEARVPETGRWADLEASLRHDVTATYRLAVWLGLISPVSREPEPVV